MRHILEQIEVLFFYEMQACTNRCPGAYKAQSYTNRSPSFLEAVLL